MTLKPWQRQPDESSLAFEAFVAYRDMMSNRSTRRVAELLEKHKSQIDGWSSTHGWVARVQAWETELDKRACTAQVAEVKAMKRRQARIALEMQSAAELGLVELKKRLEIARQKAEEHGKLGKPLMSPDHIVRLADTGAKLERLSYDEPDSITKVQDADFSNLNAEEMMQLRALLEKSGNEYGMNAMEEKEEQT